jgi:ABC-type multidrug transport system ATPase subunit
MTSPSSLPAVEVRDLTKRYKDGTLANDCLSLRIESGEVFGLLGPNGAGKTTLVLQILGLLLPTSGSVRVEGIDVVAQPQAVKVFSGYMPQTRVAMRNLELHRALAITGRLRGQPEKAARAQTEGLLSRLELQEHRNQYLDRLSGGLMRVAAFAMALMGEPRLIVLDEPTNELDPIRRRIVWETIRELNQQRQVTCLLVTHNVLEAERVVERVAVIDGGRAVALGTPGALKAQLGEEIRLEVVLKPEVSHNGHRAAVEGELNALGRTVTFRPGHYAVFVERKQVPGAVSAVMAGLESAIDDFRLAPPSLEDVYIHLAGQKLDQEED